MAKTDQEKRYPSKHPVDADAELDADAEKTMKRLQSRTVNRYLTFLMNGSTGAGRPVTEDQLEIERNKIEGMIDEFTDKERWLKVLEWSQKLNDLGARAVGPDYEREFIEVAKSYSDRQGITYGTWRGMGVTARVLKSAGIPIKLNSGA